MTSKEAMVYHLKILKDKPLKEKLYYIATYYWKPILLVVFLISTITFQVIHVSSMKDPALSGICINSSIGREEIDTYMENFASSAGIDTDEFCVEMSSELYISGDDLVTNESRQVLTAKITSQNVDFIISDINVIMDYAYAEYFLQLDEYLTFAQLENLHSRILYADLQAVDDTSSSSYPDPTKPEIMVSPVPVAIVLPKYSEFVQTFSRLPKKTSL